MAFKLVILAAALACANAGYLTGAHVAAPVAHYSPATAVSSSYINQASPAVGYAHAAPVAAVGYAHAAPVAAVGYAHAAPVATIAHAPVAVHAPAIGSSHQSVVRGLGGSQAVSHYSKAVDSAFSSVRKYDTRITNDALSVAHAPVVSSYASPVVSSYAAPAVGYAHAAPALGYAHAAPALGYAHAAPALGYAKVATPVVAKAAVPVAYSPAAVVSHMTFSGLGVNYGW